jgi:hypothetical protein
MQIASGLGLDRLATYGALSPFEAEMRRRLWWSICRHEAAYAEEINDRKSLVAQTTNIALPSNFNDNDLSPDMTSLPAPRIGLSDMSFALMMFEIVRLVGQIAYFIHEKAARVGCRAMAGSPSTREWSKGIVEEARMRIEQGTLNYCDVSRPFDWLILLVAKIILVGILSLFFFCTFCSRQRKHVPSGASGLRLLLR